MPQAFQFQSLVTQAATIDRPLGLCSRIAQMIRAKLQTARERRGIMELGPYGRRELHALLIARGGRGIPETIWTVRDWAEDTARF